MKKVGWKIFLLVLVGGVPFLRSPAQTSDTLISKKELREARRADFRTQAEKTLISGSYVLAFLTTTASFEIANGILTAQVGLEKNLGLSHRHFTFNSSLIQRFTPRSGLYMSYYSLHRGAEYTLQEDIIFVDDTISLNTKAWSFFNTDVYSLGYLYTILENRDLLLAAYCNVYFMRLRTGVRSTDFLFNEETNFTAPLPDLGLIATVHLRPRLELGLQIGFFALSTPDFGGSLTSLSINLRYTVLKWLSLAAGYQEFGVNVFFQTEGIDTRVQYQLKGPSLGLQLAF